MPITVDGTTDNGSAWFHSVGETAILLHMTTDTEEPTLTIDELAARAGTTVRTVRFYSTKGLLPPPVIGARRVGHYGQEHLSRLALIEELQQQGMTLAAIERYVAQLPPDLTAHDLAIHRAVVASWAPEGTETLDRRELERRAGRALDEEDVERLVAMGVVGLDGGSYRVDSGLLRLGGAAARRAGVPGGDPRVTERADRAFPGGGPRVVAGVPRGRSPNGPRRT